MTALEHNEQIHFIEWLRNKHPDLITIISPIVKYGGSYKQRLIQGRKQKLMGYMKGTLDIFIPKPVGIYHGLFIEMKSEKGSTEPDQIIMLSKLRAEDYFAQVCYSCNEAIKTTEQYLNNKGGLNGNT